MRGKIMPITVYDNAQLSKIEQAIKQYDWFTALVLTATQLERHGHSAIKKHLKAYDMKTKLIDTLLSGLHLRNIAEILEDAEIINHEEYQTIIKINKERNKFIHQREFRRNKVGKEAVQEYKLIVIEGMKILKEKLNVIRIFAMK